MTKNLQSADSVDGNHSRMRAGLHKIGLTIATIAVAAGLQLALPGSALAIEPVDCFSGPPTPITLITPFGNLCFGGALGVESLGVFVEDFSSGDYSVALTVLSNVQPGHTYVISFEPNEFSAINAHVTHIAII